MTKEEEIFLRILRESPNFDSTTNNIIRITYTYALSHKFSQFILGSTLKLENILYYNHIFVISYLYYKIMVSLS